MTPENAILLLRISDDKAGDEHGVQRQERTGRAHAARLSWTIGRVVVENDTSAFKRKKILLPDGRHERRTVRPAFREALDLLATRTCDGMLVADLDRLARDPRDLEDLIDVIEASEPRIPVTSVTGSLTLDHDDGITMARMMVNWANKSSRDTRRRVVDHQQDLALQGKPTGGGHRPFGYERGGAVVREDEAAVVRWMAGRVLDPDEYWSLSRIARELQRRGIPTATGRTYWQDRTVATILTRPRIAGYRVYRGQIVGDAVWPAVLERPVWEAVCAELTRREPGAGNELKRWLNGVLICGRGECGHRMMGGSGLAGPRYWCNPGRGGCGRITIKAVDTEAEVERQVLEYLADPLVVGRLRAVQETLDAAAVRRDLAEDEAQLREMAGMWARREVTLVEYREARGLIGERIERNRGLLKSSTPRAARVLAGSEDPAAAWEGFAPAAKRDVVLSLVAGYRVLPFPPGRARRFDPGRLVPVPHDRGDV